MWRPAQPGFGNFEHMELVRWLLPARPCQLVAVGCIGAWRVGCSRTKILFNAVVAPFPLCPRARVQSVHDKQESHGHHYGQGYTSPATWPAMITYAYTLATGTARTQRQACGPEINCTRYHLCLCRALFSEASNSFPSLARSL